MDKLIDSTEAAQLLGVSRQTLYSYVSRGLLRVSPAPDGRGSRYVRAEVERLAERAKGGRRPRAAAQNTLDFGLPILQSSLTLIADGELWYRGLAASQLAQTQSLEAVAQLLWQADEAVFSAEDMPAPNQRLHAAQSLEQALAQFAQLTQGLPAVAVKAEPPLQHARAALLLRYMAQALLGGDLPKQALHLHCATLWQVGDDAAELIRRALVLSADHELNASSFTARCVASTHASLQAAVIGGMAALSGPRHGAATERVEKMWAQCLVGTWREPDPLRTPGFGHRLYPDGDPRARCLLKVLQLPMSLQALCVGVEASGGALPNIDFALVALCQQLRLPHGAAAKLFALGRTVGWLAHALEQRAQGSLIRPRADYVGAAPATPQIASGRIVRMKRI